MTRNKQVAQRSSKSMGTKVKIETQQQQHEFTASSTDAGARKIQNVLPSTVTTNSTKSTSTGTVISLKRTSNAIELSSTRILRGSKKRAVALLSDTSSSSSESQDNKSPSSCSLTRNIKNDRGPIGPPTPCAAANGTNPWPTASSPNATSVILSERTSRLKILYDKLNTITVEIEELQASTRLKVLYDQVNAITEEAGALHDQIKKNSMLLQQYQV